MTWRDPTTDPNEENTDVLVYTDENKFKIARLCMGRWDTYQKVLFWQSLPEPPKDKPTKVKKGKKGARN